MGASEKCSATWTAEPKSGWQSLSQMISVVPNYLNCFLASESFCLQRTVLCEHWICSVLPAFFMSHLSVVNNVIVRDCLSRFTMNLYLISVPLVS